MDIIAAITTFIQDHLLLSLVVAFFCFRIFFARGASGKFEEYPGNKVIDCKTREDFMEQIKLAASRNMLVVIDFYALWCGPCRYAAPSYGKMSTEYDNVVFLKVDVDSNGTVARVSPIVCFLYLQFFAFVAYLVES